MINLPKFFRSVGYSLSGIKALIISENNARIHLLATILVISVSLYLQISSSDWLWIALAITLVWLAECFNTAIETVVDLASPNFHSLAKKAKDIAAGSVLFAAIFAIVVAILVFGKYF